MCKSSMVCYSLILLFLLFQGIKCNKKDTFKERKQNTINLPLEKALFEFPSSPPTNLKTQPPTDVPIFSPSSSPTFPRTSAPTSPTLPPSTHLTASPTAFPSDLPSSTPTDKPSTKPTLLPTLKPTFSPTVTPTDEPTAIPTASPTQPSSQPTSQPSGQPSFNPTFVSPRVLECNEEGFCDSLEGDCDFFTEVVILQCSSDEIPCLLQAESFSVGPNTTLRVEGNCDLVFIATSTITVKEKSIIRATTMNITGDKIDIYGGLSTSGRGPMVGPGSPLFPDQKGFGGSYGGTGGRRFNPVQDDCFYFSNLDSQLGNITVIPDVLDSNSSGVTLGSGGGPWVGAGSGGGRIWLKAKESIYLASSGFLAAEGSSPSDATLGAGSGGSIILQTKDADLFGLISVKGGDSLGFNGAGGGGRISVELSASISESETILNKSIFSLVGGQSNETFSNCSLSVGSPGTLFLRSKYITEIHTDGKQIKSKGVTLIDSFPEKTNLISILHSAAVSTSTGLISLWRSDSCENTENVQDCSTFILKNATLVGSLNNSEEFIGFYSFRNSSLLRVNVDNFLVLNESLIRPPENTLTSFDFIVGNMELSSDSNIIYTNKLAIEVKYKAILHGLISVWALGYGNPSAFIYEDSRFLIVSTGGNLTFNKVFSSAMLAVAENVFIEDDGFLSLPPGFRGLGCVSSEILVDNFTCVNNSYNPQLIYNHSIVLIANDSVEINKNGEVRASRVLLCAPTVIAGNYSKITASGLGCAEGLGPGAGEIGNYGISGGGGAGYGGIGGSGFNAINYGVSYYVQDTLQAGSGGGCNNCSTSEFGEHFSYGGGIVSVVATKQMILRGNLTSNGEEGGLNGGGGAGGTVFIQSDNLVGSGVFSTNGGAGGNGDTPGGGGGGGYLKIFNSKKNNNQFQFVGIITAEGGNQGFFTGMMSLNNSQNQTKFQNLRKNRKLQASAAEPGADGIIILPECAEGYGNNLDEGIICQLCPVGMYGVNSVCQPCTNAPSHSTYTTSGATSSDCPFQCDSGYSTDQCLDPFTNFLLNTLGVGGIVGCVLALILLIFLPFFYYLNRKRFVWITNTEKDILAMFKITSMDGTSDYNFEGNLDSAKPRRSLLQIATQSSAFVQQPAADQLETTENPMLLKSVLHDNFRKKSAIISDDSSHVSVSGGKELAARKAGARTLKEIQLAHRLTEPDLSSHGSRIYFLGSNHPHQNHGGPWVLSDSRPVCLRPTIKRKEFKNFTELINKEISWPNWGYELLVFYVLSFFVPPLSAVFLWRFRRERASKLLQLIAKYDYSCFKCPKQRKARNSLRVGISPDCTLAYIDILFDENVFNPANKPLCPIGQVKLPVALKLAGFGTYFSPFYVDTNDILLQAVPQTDIPSSFIDDAWISFAVKLNNILRNVQSDAIRVGLIQLMKFLQNEKTLKPLGGVIVQFCTFSNVPRVFPSERFEKSEEMYLTQLNEYKIPQNPIQTTVIDTNKESFSKMRSLSNREEALRASYYTDRESIILSPPPDGSPSLPHEIERKTTWNTNIENEPGNNDFLSNRSNSMTRSDDENIFFTFRFYFYSCILSIRDALKKFLLFLNSLFRTNKFKPSDPEGLTLSFEDMCSAVQEGKLSLGILVTHPKVKDSSYIALDEDYESSDELDFSDNPTDDALENSQNPKSEKSENDERKESVATGDSESIFSNDTLTALQPYGERASELSKFYRIMKAADNNIRLSESKKDITSTLKIDKKPDVESFTPIEDKKISFKEKTEENSDKPKEEENPDTSTKKSKNSNSPPRQKRESFTLEEGYTELIASPRAKSRKNTILPDEQDSDDSEASIRKLERQDTSHSTEGGYSHFPVKTPKTSDKPQIPLTFESESAKTHLGDSMDEELKKTESETENEKTEKGEVQGKKVEDMGVVLKLPSSSTSKGKKRSSTPKKNPLKKDLTRLNLAPSALQQPINVWQIFEGFPVQISEERPSIVQSEIAVESDGILSRTISRESLTPYNINALITDAGGIDDAKKDSMVLFQSNLEKSISRQMPTSSDDTGSHANAVADDLTNNYSFDQSQLNKFNLVEYFKSVKSFIRYMYVNKLFLFYLSRLLFGSNVYPYGPADVRKILKTSFFLLSIMDIALSILILAGMFCLSENVTKCQDHTYMTLVITVWPGALIIAPICGIQAILLGPSGILTRIYASWSRLAVINITIILVIVFFYYQYFRDLPGGVYPVFLLTSSRLFQCLFVDLYIAHIEKLRYTRGWDGLNTSLYKTKDNVKSIPST